MLVNKIYRHEEAKASNHSGNEEKKNEKFAKRKNVIIKFKRF